MLGECIAACWAKGTFQNILPNAILLHSSAGGVAISASASLNHSTCARKRGWGRSNACKQRTPLLLWSQLAVDRQRGLSLCLSAEISRSLNLVREHPIS
eukprot:SAG11_NODE_138_length_15111_cov_11.388289_2_plen_99_part_00